MKYFIHQTATTFIIVSFSTRECRLQF